MSPNLTLLPNKLQKEVNDEVSIDPLASVHPGAVLHPGCKVGAYAIVGEDVMLGPQCEVHPHGVVTGPTRMGEGNVIFPFACVGGAPQDLRHQGESTELHVGDRNTFREHVTVNRGTVHGGGRTVIGCDNLLMAYCHVAHDCILGDRIVMANGATLAGHVTVQDHVVFGGMVAVASFVRIGESAMLAAGAMLEKDVLPFAMVSGDRARLKGVNTVGITRRGFSSQAKLEIRRLVRQLKKTAVPLSDILHELASLKFETPEAHRAMAFLQHLPRGLTR